MKIVIELPDEDYQVTLTKIMLACNGCKITELPKGYGRLGDLDILVKHNVISESYANMFTIIEADKEDEADDE